MPATSAYYEFGDFALDVGQQCLLRRDTGQTTLLTAKVLDTLVYFVEHAGETLDKDVLLRSIWPGTVVEENSLTQNVSTCARCWAKRAVRIATSRRFPAGAIALSRKSRVALSAGRV